MLKSIAMSLLVAMGSFGYDSVEDVKSVEVVNVNEVVENENIELDVFFMYGNEIGTYWLEPTADYENVVFVGYDALEKWNIDMDDLHHGKRLIGTFDNEGWELLGLEWDNE